jgi:hypothetical protein
MTKKYMFSKSKITISGSIFELYDYEKAIWHGQLPQSKCKSANAIRSKNGQRSEASFRRAKGKLMRLINANIDESPDKKLRPRFLTFTFGENIVDIKKANQYFTKFIRKFNNDLRYTKNNLKYVAVIEFQKRGAVHYHVLFFNLPFIKKIYDRINELWGHGFVIQRKINRVKNLGAYLGKYITKQADDNRLYDEKCYFASKGLKKPRTIHNQSIVDFVSEFIPEKIKPYEKTIPSDHCGNIKYRRYDLTDHQELKKTLLAFIK